MSGSRARVTVEYIVQTMGEQGWKDYASHESPPDLDKAYSNIMDFNTGGSLAPRSLRVVRRTVATIITDDVL